MSLEQIFTSVVALVMIASAISMILSRNMIMSILSMVLTAIFRNKLTVNIDEINIRASLKM